MNNTYDYIDSPHSEMCGCSECVQSVTFSGQTYPCGWVMTVRWSLDDCIAHAEGDDAESIRHLYATSGDGTPPSEDMLAEGEREMKALCARIEGRRFESAEALHSYLRHDLQLSRDFD
jgi:hypothetical protein